MSAFVLTAACSTLRPAEKIEASLYTSHPVKKAAFWGNFASKDMTEKIRVAPPEVIDYLVKDNKLQNWPQTPHAPQVVQKEFLNDLNLALRELPKEVVNGVNRKLAGIVLVENLGGSALTDYVIDASKISIGGFIALDISAVNRKANDWATWKENSPFKPDSKIRLIAEIEKPEDNNRKNAIQYILLHELGHVYSIGRTDVAPWRGANEERQTLSNFNFTALSWTLRDGKTIRSCENVKLCSAKLPYYAEDEKKLSADFIPADYADLVKTGFPTLYAATNPFDDFAESYANYIHTIEMKKPWQISIYEGNRQSMKVDSCWDEERCRAKRIALENALRIP